MDTARYGSRLRYLDAGKLDDSEIDFDGLDVYGWEHEKLGDIDGFIADGETGRVYYAVLDSGGWFRSRHFLLPIGHLTRYDGEKRELHVDLAKEALRTLPEFDEDRFKALSDEELRSFDRQTQQACCPDRAVVTTEVWAFTAEPHYAEPQWWTDSRRGSARRQGDEARPGRQRAAAAMPGSPPPAPRTADRETVRARAEESAVRGGDVSPHSGGRAQPGDVLGVETGGETTSIGDTAQDEDERRRDAEREAGKKHRR